MSDTFELELDWNWIGIGLNECLNVLTILYASK